MIDCHMTLTYVQKRIISQLEHNTVRFGYLHEKWKYEVDVYSTELAGSLD